MKNLIISLLTIVAVSTISIGATYAVFSDTETSLGNTFTAGTLDLKINSGDVNVSNNYTNMRPGNQPNFTHRLRNDGSIPGKLTISNLVVSNNENGCVEPEIEALDTSCDNPGLGQGELSSVLGYRIIVDTNCSGWLDAGEQTIYNGMANSLGTNYDLGTLAPGAEVCINSLVNWWSTSNDNLAQSDSMIVDFTYSLSQ